MKYIHWHFYPQREMRSISSRGSIDFSSYFICLSNRILHFRNHYTAVTFFYPENVLSPEGRCVAYPVGVQLFLHMFCFGIGNKLKKDHPSRVILEVFLLKKFYPPKGDA